MSTFAPSEILATAVVPWTADFKLDEPVFRREVATIARGLTRHIYVFGTAGEGYAVSDAQFEQIARFFWQCAGEHGVRPMLGVISLSLPTIIERIELGRALGYREFQISLPSWGALNDRELDRFFAETCGRFPDCHFLHYNLARSRRLLTPAEYGRLAAAHPNLVAVKASLDDPAVIQGLLTAAPQLRFYFTEFGHAVARRFGACGLLASLSTINYRRSREFVAGDDAVREAMVAEMRVIVASLHAVAKERFHIDGAYDKLLFRMNDPEFPLRLLPPYDGASEAAVEEFRASLPAAWR